MLQVAGNEDGITAFQMDIKVGSPVRLTSFLVLASLSP